MAGLFCWVVNTMAKYKPTEFMAEDSRYDKKSADYAVNFIECLSHTKGTWAGKKFELLDPHHETWFYLFNYSSCFFQYFSNMQEFQQRTKM